MGTGILDDIVDSCVQHECDGYILVTSTQPSSTVVEQINNNPKNSLSTAYWDAVHLERMLSTPKLWAIAQRFFPTR
ncbi:hypothetical protein [Marinomonas algicola]|uniref:hypothetical protein n=1 Tax=Marinomonas algicola TaxID=2773454 RepID=UPI00174B4456|nr:hypothetical protein [Marinomonas algicola]